MVEGRYAVFNVGSYNSHLLIWLLHLMVKQAKLSWFFCMYIHFTFDESQLFLFLSRSMHEVYDALAARLVPTAAAIGNPNLK